MMNEGERLQLQKMIQANGTQDLTEEIRRTKHSLKIRTEAFDLAKFRDENLNLQKNNPEDFNNLCINKFRFLFNNYTDIFNRVKKDEIDLDILTSLLNTLEKIENGDLDQHEGSFEVGKYLKKMYIDSAIKKSEKLDAEYKEEIDESKTEPKNINWSNFKKKNNL